MKNITLIALSMSGISNPIVYAPSTLQQPIKIPVNRMPRNAFELRASFEEDKVSNPQTVAGCAMWGSYWMIKN